MSRKKPLIAGNWKMYKTIEEASFFIETLTPLIQNSQATVYLAVPFTAIYSASHRVREMKAPIVIGGQNMHDALEGAYTGEISSLMLKEAGAQFVILGHSERRHLFHESSAFVNKKIKCALLNEIQPILCIGETLEERERGETEDVLQHQLLESLEGVESLDRLILAYEPVWAIGTGKVAHSADAERAHLFCRDIIAKKWGGEAAETSMILYGGSVKSDNAAELMSQKNIDGVLVGGASLQPKSFSQIVIESSRKSS